MKIRADSVLISSVLFTVALLCLIPPGLALAFTGHDRMALAKLDAGFQAAAQTMGEIGAACLAIILIGLIVTWTGYVKRVRWTWFVMFIIVWGWAFPLLILPIIEMRKGISLTEWFRTAMREAGPYRDLAKMVLIFMLMLIALTLPIRAFFFRRETTGSLR